MDLVGVEEFQDELQDRGAIGYLELDLKRQLAIVRNHTSGANYENAISLTSIPIRQFNCKPRNVPVRVQRPRGKSRHSVVTGKYEILWCHVWREHEIYNLHIRMNTLPIAKLFFRNMSEDAYQPS